VPKAKHTVGPRFSIIAWGRRRTLTVQNGGIPSGSSLNSGLMSGSGGIPRDEGEIEKKLSKSGDWAGDPNNKSPQLNKSTEIKKEKQQENEEEYEYNQDDEIHEPIEHDHVIPVEIPNSSSNLTSSDETIKKERVISAEEVSKLVQKMTLENPEPKGRGARGNSGRSGGRGNSRGRGNQGGSGNSGAGGRGAGRGDQQTTVKRGSFGGPRGTKSRLQQST